MRPRRAAILRAPVPLLALALSTLACGDATGPQGEITVHLAHAAPGAGPFVLTFDDEILADPFDAGDGVVTTVVEGGHTVSLDGVDEDIEIHPFWDADLRTDAALVLLNPADPALIPFEPAEDVPLALVALTVINGVPNDSVLRVSLTGESSSARVGAAFANSGRVGVSPGTYTVSAVFQDPESFIENPESAVEFGEVTLDEHVHFLVIGPDESGTGPGFVVVF